MEPQKTSYFTIFDTNAGFLQWCGFVKNPILALTACHDDHGIHEDFDSVIKFLDSDCDVYGNDCKSLLEMNITEIRNPAHVKAWVSFENADGEEHPKF